MKKGKFEISLKKNPSKMGRLKNVNCFLLGPKNKEIIATKKKVLDEYFNKIIPTTLLSFFKVWVFFFHRRKQLNKFQYALITIAFCLPKLFYRHQKFARFFTANVFLKIALFDLLQNWLPWLHDCKIAANCYDFKVIIQRLM